MSEIVTVAAQVQVFVNSVLYGQVSSFKFSSSTHYKEQYALDSLVPYELSPTVCKVAGQVSVYKLTGDGGLEGQGITAHFEDLSRQQYFTLTLRDLMTDDVIFESQFTVVSEQSQEVSAKGMMMISFSFSGISWTA